MHGDFHYLLFLLSYSPNPTDFHVGDVFSSDPTNLKPVVECDMQKPEPVAALRNTYKA